MDTFFCGPAFLLRNRRGATSIRWKRRPLTFIAIAGLFAIAAGAQTPEKPPIDQLIPWLLRENHQLRAIPFSQVIFDTTGKRVLAIGAIVPTSAR
jgi:hypothetical protein